MSVGFIGDGIAIRNKGDIISGDGSGIISVPAGSNDQILTASSTTGSGLLWESRDFGVPQSFVQISATTVTANTAQVNIDGIPQSYNDVLLILMGQGTVSSAPSTINITFNSASATGTPASVSYGSVSAAGSTGTNTISVVATSQVGTLNNYIVTQLPPSATSQANGIIQLRINSYTTSYPTFSGFQASAYNSGVTKANGNRIRFFNGGLFGPAGVVSNIRFAGNIKSGSVFYLYGIKN
jgi:hypothetical protein